MVKIRENGEKKKKKGNSGAPGVTRPPRAPFPPIPGSFERGFKAPGPGWSRKDFRLSPSFRNPGNLSQGCDAFPLELGEVFFPPCDSL